MMILSPLILNLKRLKNAAATYPTCQHPILRLKCRFLAGKAACEEVGEELKIIKLLGPPLPRGKQLPKENEEIPG